MKKSLFLLIIAALLILPGVVLAQSDTLSHAEITRISNSVVLVLALDSNGDPFDSGSGTIIASDRGDLYQSPRGRRRRRFRHSHAGRHRRTRAAHLLTRRPSWCIRMLISPSLQIDRDANGDPSECQHAQPTLHFAVRRRSPKSATASSSSATLTSATPIWS